MKRTTLAVSISLMAMQSHAMDQVFDTRSMGMGGVGVASSNTRNAAFLNPGMLPSNAEDAFAWEIPVVGVRVLDEKDLQSNADALSTSGDNLSTALQNFQTAQTNYSNNPSAGNLSALQSSASSAGTALSGFNTELNKVSGKAINAGGFVGTMLGIPSKSVSFALTVDARAELGAQFNYVAADSATVGTLANNLSLCGGGDTAACTNASAGVDANGNVTGMQSTLDARGVVISEVGIGMARHFDEWGGFDLGITPKYSKLRMFDVSTLAQQSNGVSTNNSNNENKASMFNMDIGFAKNINVTDDGQLRAGLMVKDIAGKNFKTVLGNDIVIKPRATAGVGYKTKLTTTGFDLDLVPNKSMVAGYGSDSQFARLGVELDAWRWAQLRLGYRHDLKGNYKGLSSVGLGLSLLGLHIDCSYAAAGNTEKAAAIQLGLHF
jgi:hypothetical protein